MYGAKHFQATGRDKPSAINGSLTSRVALILIMTLVFGSTGCAYKPITPKYPRIYSTIEQFSEKHPRFTSNTDDEIVRMVLSGAHSKLTSFYNRELSKEPVTGSLILGFAVNANGSILELQLLRDEIRSARFTDKVMAELRTLQFPPYLDGQGRVFDFVINFYPEASDF